MINQIDFDSDANNGQGSGGNSGPADPFGMMISPESIIQRMERSTQLSSLRTRVLRPLDAPWILRTAGKAKITEEMAAADAKIERDFGFLN